MRSKTARKVEELRREYGALFDFVLASLLCQNLECIGFPSKLPSLAVFHRLHETAALWRLLLLDQAEIQRRVSIPLDDGFESPSFRKLASTPDPSPAQSAALIEEALRAWFPSPPGADTVRPWLVTHWASQIPAGEIGPHEGADRIASVVAGTALLKSDDELKELVAAQRPAHERQERQQDPRVR